VLEHHVEAMGRLLCRRGLQSAQSDSIANSEAEIVSDVANRFLGGADQELLRSLQHCLTLVRLHLALEAAAGRRTLLPAIMPILGKIAALAHAPHPIHEKRPELKQDLDSLIDTTDLLVRFAASGGLYVDRGFLCDLFATDGAQRRVVLRDALVLPHEGEIESKDQISAFLDMVATTNRPVLIFAADVTGRALCEVIRRSRRGLRACVVRAPGAGDSLRAVINDVAVLTGARAVTKDLRIPLGSIAIAELGQASCVAVDSSSTEISGGGGNMVEIKRHLERLRGEAEAARAASEWDGERAEERLARFDAALPPDEGGNSLLRAHD
jgi:hypothetical protein